MNDRVPVRLVFADRGVFHEVTIHLPAQALARHERLVDALREDPEILGEVYVDGRRLVTAMVLNEAAE